MTVICIIIRPNKDSSEGCVSQPRRLFQPKIYARTKYLSNALYAKGEGAMDSEKMLLRKGSTNRVK